MYIYTKLKFWPSVVTINLKLSFLYFPRYFVSCVKNYVFYRSYVIVDFPEESTNGIMSMALISSTWLVVENKILYCTWPTYLKSTLSREKAVKTHTPLNLDKCVKCNSQIS